MAYKPKAGTGAEMDMTPMIDCVFQLIIFFMLVTDFANSQIERVMLPKATEAEEDKDPAKKRLMINLVHQPDKNKDCPDFRKAYDEKGDLVNTCANKSHWKVKVSGEVYSYAQLEEYLSLQGDANREPSTDGGKTKGLSNRPLMIRSDAAAVYELLEKVFAACARARIWKIEIGASKPPKQK